MHLQNWMVKVADFGTSKMMAASTQAMSNVATVASSPSMTSKIGTILYMAPEILTTGTYGSPIDVFSFGMSMWVTAVGTGEEPYSDYSTFTIADAIIGNTSLDSTSFRCTSSHLKLSPSWTPS